MESGLPGSLTTFMLSRIPNMCLPGNTTAMEDGELFSRGLVSKFGTHKMLVLPAGFFLAPTNQGDSPKKTLCLF